MLGALDFDFCFDVSFGFGGQTRSLVKVFQQLFIAVLINEAVVLERARSRFEGVVYIGSEIVEKFQNNRKAYRSFPGVTEMFD